MMLWHFQSLGTTSSFKDRVKRWCSGAVNESAQLFNIFGPMLSGPTALEVCRDLHSLNTSSRLKETSEMVLNGMGTSCKSDNSIVESVKTE